MRAVYTFLVKNSSAPANVQRQYLLAGFGAFAALAYSTFSMILTPDAGAQLRKKQALENQLSKNLKH